MAAICGTATLPGRSARMDPRTPLIVRDEFPVGYSSYFRCLSQGVQSNVSPF
jgi:hypothetical protein